ncbi:hypothetical protein PAPYR_8627 [Paratrimastix pyriformis]|uniref:Uncharacterized protein n=1 Tax=Paratrimastix pyriformis TaxID=342808 RepID=A0ABQ8UHF2_9EUKA|nr:hypothetical protein PAPYR_8627 [Paratrimastix pyriformis]
MKRLSTCITEQNMLDASGRLQAANQKILHKKQHTASLQTRTATESSIRVARTQGSDKLRSFDGRNGSEDTEAPFTPDREAFTKACSTSFPSSTIFWDPVACPSARPPSPIRPDSPSHNFGILDGTFDHIARRADRSPGPAYDTRSCVDSNHPSPPKAVIPRENRDKFFDHRTPSPGPAYMYPVTVDSNHRMSPRAVIPRAEKSPNLFRAGEGSGHLPPPNVLDPVSPRSA